MNSQLSDQIPHELDLPDIPSSDNYDPSFSDDLEALHAQQGDIAAENKRKGVVVQHRRWPLVEAFRSDDNRSFGIPSSQPVHKRPTEGTLEQQLVGPALTLASSPPVAAMPFISSPVAYPATSSAPPSPDPKRQHPVDHARSPLRDVHPNEASRSRAAFMEDSDSEDDAEDALMQQTVTGKRAAVAENEECIDSAREEATTVRVLESSENALLEKHAAAASQTAAAEAPSLGLSLFGQRIVSTTTLGDSSPSNGTSIPIRTTSGKRFTARKKAAAQALSYERTIAARSETAVGKAQRSYYGIDIHSLISEAKAESEIDAAQAEKRQPVVVPTVEQPPPGQRQQRTLMWTEKYRARKFTELVGDDRTHRSVMHWLKRWDDIVFPGSAKPKSKKKNGEQQTEERPHRKILLLTGPPGLGKTTLAHVCARQAGYEVQEINASDERSSNVVKGRIRDMAGTENVKNGVEAKTVGGKIRRAARPVCVVVDEVDGVVGGNSGSGGEGGFIKALIDLVNLDQRNSNKNPAQQNNNQKKKKGDGFRLLRPLILICNDVYHPALRPLRQSTIAEIIHVRKPPVSMVITRLQSILAKENIPFDSDGVRRLCEATWGITSKKEGGAGSSSTSEGDIRGILVVGEWIASKLRAAADPVSNATQRLTRRWIEQNVLADLSHGGGASRGLGRGGPKDLVERIFREGAGFAKAALTAANPASSTSISGVKGVAEAQKRNTILRLAEMINTSDSSDRIMTDCFTAYPSHPFQDDTVLSKPDQAYEWLHFSDSLSSKVFGSSEWELAPYLSSPILAFHNLFASPSSSRYTMGGNWSKDGGEVETDEEPLPFSGPQANYQAYEATKETQALLDSVRGGLSPPLSRMYSSPAELATEFLPYLSRFLSPSVTPVLVGGSGAEKSTASIRKASEKVLVNRAVNAMLATGVRFERSRVEFDALSSSSGPAQHGGWIYRMEPALDEAGLFPTMTGSKNSKESVRFAVRQVLQQEFSREEKRLAEAARRNRGGMNHLIAPSASDVEASAAATAAKIADASARRKIKRDFFGRVIAELTAEEEAEEAAKDREGGEARRKRRRIMDEAGGDEGRIWITFHEGFSNAVRKPVSLRELMAGL